MSDAEELLREFNEHYARSLPEALQLRGRLVVVFGVGAVGSFVAAQLAHHGCDLLMIDRDVIERANQARFYLSGPEHFRKPKVAALETQLRRELPAIQRIDGVVAATYELSRERMDDVFASASLVVASTGQTLTDLVLDQWAAHRSVPIVFPSLWAGQHAVLGDLHVVNWNLPRRRRGSCFQCLHPQQEIEPSPAEAQPALRAEVLRVASFTTEVALALLVEGSNRAALMRNLERGANYFVIPRWPPSLRAVITRPRRGCPTCSTGGSAAAAVSARRNTVVRDWFIGLALMSALVWHFLIPGLDALATIVLIVVAALWWQGRLPSYEEAAAWLRRIWGGR